MKNEFFKIPWEKPPKMTGAKLKGTVAAIASLCIVCTVFFASLLTSGCNEKNESSIMDFGTFLQSLNDAPVALVSKDNLPKWLKERIDLYEGIGSEFGLPSPGRFYRGTWNGRVIYFISSPAHSCPMCDVYYENGERIIWSGDGRDTEKFRSESKGWVLIYQTGNQGLFQKSGLSDIERLSVTVPNSGRRLLTVTLQ